MTRTPSRSGIRMTAEERRGSVLVAAIAAFADGGYAGTSTEEIARRAGISQPYLFRLFGTKRELFLAAVAAGFDRVERTFLEASAGLEGDAALMQMGLAYSELLGDSELLRLQLHAYAASGDETIRVAVAARFAELARFIAERTGATPEKLAEFLSTGMLLNVVAALQVSVVDGMWAGVICVPAELAALGAPAFGTGAS